MSILDNEGHDPSGLGNQRRAAAEWKSIDQDPGDGDFRLYGLWVRNAAGHTWFETHYVAVDPDGGLLDSALDSFSYRSYDDFQMFCDVPAPPDRHLEAKQLELGSSQ